MSFWLLLYFALVFFSLAILLASPYLRITSLGWFIAIWCLPYVGALAFVFTVVRARKSGHQYRCTQWADTCQHNPKKYQLLERLGFEYDYLPYAGIVQLSLLRDDEFVEDLFQAIDAARSRIWIATYILSGDIKKQLIKKLVDAHDRHVEVRMLIDRLGSGVIFKPQIPIKNNDIPFEISVFRPSRLKSLFFIEKRLHSKIILLDNTAYLGAHNLRDEVIDCNEDSVHNLSIKFSGTVVKQVETLFTDIWYVNKREYIHIEQTSVSFVQPSDEISARMVFSDPIEYSHNYNRYLTTLFNAARKRICIWMAYVIPTQSMRTTIIAASKIGLDVRVLIPNKTDSALVDNAHDLVLKELCDNGVSCAVGKGGFDHSKVLIIDDLTVIGSSNLDYRSLYRNYEANIEINDQAFTQSMLKRFDRQFEQAERLTGRNRPLWVHMKNQLTSLVAGLY